MRHRIQPLRRRRMHAIDTRNPAQVAQARARTDQLRQHQGKCQRRRCRQQRPATSGCEQRILVPPTEMESAAGSAEFRLHHQGHRVQHISHRTLEFGYRVGESGAAVATAVMGTGIATSLCLVWELHACIVRAWSVLGNQSIRIG